MDHKKHAESLRDLMLENLAASRGKEDSLDEKKWSAEDRVKPATKHTQDPVEFDDDGKVKSYAARKGVGSDGDSGEGEGGRPKTDRTPGA